MSRAATALGVLLLILATALPSLAQHWIDPDYFWHVRLGETLRRGGAVYAPDEVSYLTERSPYRRHSWGAEVVMSALDERLGLPGYRAGRMALRAALVLLVAAACLRAGRSPAFSLACAAAIVPIARVACEVRPIGIAYVILAGLALLHVAPRRTPGRAAFAVTFLLMALLTNIHPISVVALAWVGACGVGAWLEMRGARGDAVSLAARARAAYYALLTLAAMVALAIDPRPFGAVESLWKVRKDPIAAGRWVTEMLPPQMIGPVGWVGVAAGVVALAALARSRRARPHEWLLLLGNLYLGLEFARNMVTLEVVALPLIARHGPALLRPLLARLRLLGRRRPLRALAGPRAAAAGAALGIVLVVASAVESGRRADLPDEPSRAHELARFPARAIDRVLADLPPSEPPRRIVVAYDWGGYAAYRLGAGYLVSHYGQAQLYAPALWEDFIDHRPEAIRRWLTGGDPEAAVVAAGDNLWRRALEDVEGWRRVHEDELAVVLVPPARERRE